MLVVDTQSADETRRLARRLAGTLRENDRLALIGELGAGKTVFAQGLAGGLGIKDQLTSPTYVLIKSYSGRLRLHHCDWYRLNSANDIWSSGFEDLGLDPGVVVVEWADKFNDVLEQPYLRVQLRSRGDNGRRLQFSVAGRSKHLSQALKKLTLDE